MTASLTFSVPDMSCGHCKASVEAALAPLSDTAEVDLATRQVTVRAAVPAQRLIAALAEIGFPAREIAP